MRFYEKAQEQQEFVELGCDAGKYSCKQSSNDQGSREIIAR